MSSSLFAAQEAVYTLLVADNGLKALIGNPARLYDVVPPSALFPYVTLGDVLLRDLDTKESTGFEQDLALHVWSRYRGRKELKEIMQVLYDALHRVSLTVSGSHFVDCRFASASTRLDDDGLTLHGALRFRLLVQH
jgi:hypothetical protein